MTYRIHLKKILWIYILAFVLTAFSFHSKADTLTSANETETSVSTLIPTVHTR